MRTATLIAIMAQVFTCGTVLAQEPPEVIARKCQEVFVKHCTKCHGTVNPQSGLSVLDLKYLTDNGFAVPGKPNESGIFERVSTNDDSLRMPPAGAIPPEEQQIIKAWIDAGVPPFPPVAAPRPFIDNQAMFLAMEADLRKYPPEDQPNLRYFSLAHLHNNPAVSDRDLRMYRAAVAKVCNSLSWQPDIVRPEPIDQYKTIYRVNLIKLGWDRGRLWNRLLSQYPYGLSFDLDRNQALRSAAEYVYGVTGTRLPCIRADWFVATATQPPLYEAMLGLPTGENADKIIEHRLNVDTTYDFINDREQRAGFNKSNVSEHNRMVARHPAAFGSYWKSYDFRTSNGKQNLLQNPLGPAFTGNKYRPAFQHDGGELIWNLPNGMQAYLLIDGKGKYIPRGPIDVVFDAKQPLNNKEVINGISCMVCHVNGMQDFLDDVREGTGLQGGDLVKLERLYLKQDDWRPILKDDRSRFMRAIEAACADYLQVDEDKDIPIEKFPEPVGGIAKQYIGDMNLTDVVAELGYNNIEGLKVLFNDPSYRQYGLGVLTQGRVIKRETWDGLQGYSVFQKVASRLQLGAPERVFP